MMRRERYPNKQLRKIICGTNWYLKTSRRVNYSIITQRKAKTLTVGRS